ncbi:hypothetical protein REH36_02270 [Pediococcus pentosaceus]|jgi:hypothetical protein|uniref:hypothetical protein n=1 Tax=Pediococcus pentosaceus TaxID=1255 RepID=UPI002B4C1167|nr:hypothetical protein [Pediococcus pentosaceus]MEB3376764.1 hypothetical protein [Pediococcus pentosaceus]
MATKAQLRANKKYEKEHPEQTKLKQAKSRAKWFIKHCDITRLDDLKELKTLINEQIEQLEK